MIDSLECLDLTIAVHDQLERRRLHATDRNHDVCAGSPGEQRVEARQIHPVEPVRALPARSEEHTSELQSLMRISYAVFCLKKKKNKETIKRHTTLKRNTQEQ